jgi:hypothetical protein
MTFARAIREARIERGLRAVVAAQYVSGNFSSWVLRTAAAYLGKIVVPDSGPWGGAPLRLAIEERVRFP